MKHFWVYAKLGYFLKGQNISVFINYSGKSNLR